MALREPKLMPILLGLRASLFVIVHATGKAQQPPTGQIAGLAATGFSAPGVGRLNGFLKPCGMCERFSIIPLPKAAGSRYKAPSQSEKQRWPHPVMLWMGRSWLWRGEDNTQTSGSGLGRSYISESHIM